jgi:ATP-dependent helicase IRC3
VNYRIEEDFIKRCNELFKEEGELYLENRRKKMREWNILNKKILVESQKKYYETDKGKYAISIKIYNRRTNYKNACEDLSWEEKQLIGQFYKNCPKGYEVDHIIPVSKGGKHCLSNLQYLTRSDNRRKHAKLDWKKD